MLRFTQRPVDLADALDCSSCADRDTNFPLQTPSEGRSQLDTIDIRPDRQQRTDHTVDFTHEGGRPKLVCGVDQCRDGSVHSLDVAARLISRMRQPDSESDELSVAQRDTGDFATPLQIGRARIAEQAHYQLVMGATNQPVSLPIM
ncbi:hypothetical protein A5630_04335 [Mycolicibacterium mucogenicum]|uniref:Uncharacterized protein n=1 Tax=Mycolicibacterium mucogenicum TaxID=56689 RepID=A0A1A3GQ86_MYCMU|nr:hypothetical protein A5630_04335 [Mycolicibacterium mucogenicum]